MKKIFTLFVAFVVCATAFATPQLPELAGKKAMQVKKAEVMAPAQVKAQEITKAKALQRDFVLPEGTKRVAPLATPKKVTKATTEGQTFTLNFDGIAVGPEYYPESGDWYVAVGDDDWTFKLDWYGEEGENKDGYLGTWTTEDFDLDYSYILDPNWDVVEMETITMTITKTTVSDVASKIALTATILGSDGNTYVISAAKEVLTPKATITAAINDASYTWDGWLATLNAKNEDLDMTIAFYASWATGPFSTIDLDMEMTSVKYKGQALELSELEMLVKAIKNEAGQVGYSVTLSMISTEPILYNVDIFAPLAPVTDTVNIEVKNMVLDESLALDWWWIFMTSVTDEWDIYAGVADYEVREASYASEDEVIFYITNLKTGEFAEQIYAEATVTNDPQYGWTLDLSSYCTDGKLYNVTMYKSVPTPTDTVTLRFEQPAMAAFYPQYGNDLILAHNENNCYLAIDIIGLELGDSFTMDDMDMEYSMLYIDLKNYKMVNMADVQGTVNQYGDTTVIAAQIISYDAVLYDVELWHVAPTPVKTVELNIEAEFVNNLNTMGYYLLRGYSADQQYFACLSPLGSSIEGTFVNDGLFGKLGAEDGQYTFNSDYCYIYKFAKDPTNPEGVTIVKGQFVVEESNGVITATASVIGSDSVQYNIAMTAAYNQHLQYDAEEGSIDRTFTTDDEVIIEEYPESESVYFEVMAADGSDICVLYFFMEETDEDIIIAPGVYTIDNSEDYNTVYASPGVMGMSVSPSFYATLTEDGYLATPLYFLVGGTVTVEKVETNIKIEVNGVNSYNVPIHVIYDATQTAVENITTDNTDAVKVIENGILYILRNGNTYNAMGLEVK